MIVGTLAVPISANWPKLVAELHAVLGPCGYSHDRLPGPVRVLADAPVAPEVLAQAQAVVDAHDPAPTAAQQDEERERRVAAGLGRQRDRLLAALTLRASSGWSSLTPERRQAIQAVIDGAADRVRDLLA